MGIADLPDIDEDEWHAYQADTFSKRVKPIADSSSFMAATEPIVAGGLDQLSQLQQQAQPLSQPVTIAPPPPPTGGGLFGAARGLFGGDGLSGGAPGASSQPYFGGAPADTSALFDELTSFSDDGADAPNYRVSTAGMPPEEPNALQQMWQGDPNKPNVFSWLGSQAQQGADELRASGATQTPIIGGLAGGLAQGAASALKNLGGTTEALRQGNIPGAAGGVLQATVGENSPLGWGKDIATEYQVPEQILPGIDPDTPVIGGLNNPRELAGLIPQLLIPETALEREAGRLIGKGLTKTVGPAAERIGSGLARISEDTPLGIVTDAERRQFHGSARPFQRVDPEKFDPEGLYGPGYYTTSSPHIAESYTAETRGIGQQASPNYVPWSVNDAENSFRALDRWIDQRSSEYPVGDVEHGFLEHLRQTRPRLTAPEGYVRAVDGSGDQWQMADVGDFSDWVTARFDEWLNGLDQNTQIGLFNNSDITEKLGRFDEDMKAAFNTNPEAPNIRAVNVPKGTRFLDIDNPLAPDEFNLIYDFLQKNAPEEAGKLGSALNEARRQRLVGGGRRAIAHLRDKNDYLGSDYYEALDQLFGGREWANDTLSRMGFDGITHEGGRIRPMLDGNGRPILHQVDVIFPDKLERVNNALSGVPGGVTSGGDGMMGALESPFFSPARTGREIGTDLALGAAGGVAGAATAPEDATWQERAGRAAVGASLAGGLGPIARSRAGIGGLLRNLGEDEAGELGVRSGRRASPRQGIPDFGEARTPISPEEWEAMTPRQRRNARDAAEAGRAYQPLSREEIRRRASMREAEKMQEEIAQEAPELAPSADALPTAEPAGDVMQRVLSEMTPEGIAAAEKWEQTAASPRLAGGWMKGFVKASQEAPWEGGQRYDKILELTGGERATGEKVGKAMADAEAAADYTPPRKLTKREKERLGNLGSMEGVLTADEQELAQKLRDNAADEMRRYHGFRSEADSKEAADKLLPFLVQFARNAQPNEPVSESLMLAGRQARAHAVALSNYATLDLHKLMADPNATKEALDVAQQAANYWSAAAQLFSRYGGEVAPSEAGRAFRSMRTPPSPLIPHVGGGSGLDEVDAAMGEGMSEAAVKATEGGVAPPTNRARLTPREKAYQDMVGKFRKAAKGLEGEEKATARATARKSGKRPGSDLDAMGLEWADVFQRDPGAAGPITDDELVRVMAGLHDIGGYRMKRDWLPRATQLNMDDPEAVKQFWKEARAAGGLSEEGAPLARFDPNVEGQSYLGGADTITKQQALSMVSKELLKDADEATAAVRQARVSGASAQELARLEADANTAYNRLGLNIKEWPEESFPIVERAMDSVRSQIEKKWPADRPKGSGLMEEVEKKRQLLAIFDQEIKKEQKLAGLVPTNWLQDALSYGTSNVLMTPRFAQASVLESALSSVNEPFQNILKGNYAAAGQQARGLARAFGFTPSTSDLAKLGEGIKAPALVNAMKAFRDIGPMESATELRDVATRGAGMIRSDSPHKIMKLLAPMHRVSRAISEGFQTANYFGEVNRLAHDAAERGVLPGGRRIEKVVGEDGALRNPTVQELFGNLPQEIVDEALKTSKKVVQGGDPGVIEKKLGDLKGLMNKPNATDWERTQGLFANLMFPFVYGLRPAIQTGVGTLFSAPVHGTQVARALMRGDTEGAKYAAKKFALANAFNGFIAYQVMSGNITGHGPSDPTTRQALMEATDQNGDPVWRPDSIRLPTPDGNVWVKYTSLPGPVSIVATVMGNMYDAYAFDGKKDETAPETAARMAQQLIPSVLDNTYFRDFINLSEAMNANGGMNSIGRIAGQVAGRFVPAAGALRLGATLTDPKSRLTTNPLEDIQSGIPGLRQQLPAQVSAYTGEDVEQPLNPITAIGGLSGNVYGRPSTPNRAAREVVELNRRPLAMPQDWESTRAVGAEAPRTFSRGEQARGTDYAQMPQTGAAIRGAQREFGREANRELLPILDSAAYQNMTPEQKAARLAAVIGTQGTARDAAEYAAKGQVQLTPQGQLDRAMSQQPQFYGVSGTPAEVAAKNTQIAQARNVLAQLSSRYGKDMAMAMLAQRSPQALTLALSYPPVNRDQLWLIEQQEQQRLGIPPEAPEDTLIPDFGSGPSVVPAQSSGLFRQQLPPSVRRTV